MIFKQTFLCSGNQKQDIAAELNTQIRDYLLGTGLFRLIAEETGEAGRPKYTLEYQYSGYQIILQSHTWDQNNDMVIGVKRGVLDNIPNWTAIGYGAVSSATITIHLIASGDSFAFKVFNAANVVCCGGSCIRYTTLKGEQEYLYNSKDEPSQLGYMGRYTTKEGGICQVLYIDYSRNPYAIIQEHPIITLNGVAIGYANDLVTIHVNGLLRSSTFSVYRFDGEEYYGGRLANGMFYDSASAFTAAALKGGSCL